MTHFCKEWKGSTLPNSAAPRVNQNHNRIGVSDWVSDWYQTGYQTGIRLVSDCAATSQPVSQPDSHSARQPDSQPTSQSSSQPASAPANLPARQPASQPCVGRSVPSLRRLRRTSLQHAVLQGSKQDCYWLGEQADRQAGGPTGRRNRFCVFCCLCVCFCVFVVFCVTQRANKNKRKTTQQHKRKTNTKAGREARARRNVDLTANTGEQRHSKARRARQACSALREE